MIQCCEFPSTTNISFRTSRPSTCCTHDSCFKLKSAIYVGKLNRNSCICGSGDVFVFVFFLIFTWRRVLRRQSSHSSEHSSENSTKVTPEHSPDHSHEHSRKHDKKDFGYTMGEYIALSIVKVCKTTTNEFLLMALLSGVVSFRLENVLLRTQPRV